MGTGSGILARTALKNGAQEVIAVDINKQAYQQIPARIHFIHSSLFTHVPGMYEVILCNPPYLPDDEEEDTASKQATTGGKKGDEFIIQFLTQAPKHLTPRGIIILLLSSRTPRTRIKQVLKKQKLTKRVLARKKLFFEQLEVWKIQREPLKGKNSND